jgi:DNA-binding transcriptional ArsR family regulator
MKSDARWRAPHEQSAPLFAALGDPTRLELVARLADGRAQSITHLTRGLRVSRQAVSKHLRVLADAGLVSSAPTGRENRWTLAPRRIEVAQRFLELMAARWDRRLEALERHLDETRG